MTTSATTTTTKSSAVPDRPLRESVSQALENYLKHLDGEPVTNLYDLVLKEVEAPLLEAVMRYTNNNQTQASSLLGLSRGTLRKKLQQHQLI